MHRNLLMAESFSLLATQSKLTANLRLFGNFHEVENELKSLFRCPRIKIVFKLLTES